jgi:DNA adenine methylase
MKSPLAYPGGKAKAVGLILDRRPQAFTSYREPFIGGGSVFLSIRQRFPTIPCWINDLNPDVFAFWRGLQIDSEGMADLIADWKDANPDGTKLYEVLREWQPSTIPERGARYFALSRMVYGSCVASGGFSQTRFNSRFTHRAIAALRGMGHVLSGVMITNLDYRECLRGQGAFIFLDPPYASVAPILYGSKRGDLHRGFPHQQFARDVRQCAHDWLITYDDCPLVRENFAGCKMEAWALQYAMVKGSKRRKGAELFIANYPYNIPQQLELALAL